MNMTVWSLLDGHWITEGAFRIWQNRLNNFIRLILEASIRHYFWWIVWKRRKHFLASGTDICTGEKDFTFIMTSMPWPDQKRWNFRRKKRKKLICPRPMKSCLRSRTSLYLQWKKKRTWMIFWKKNCIWRRVCSRMNQNRFHRRN